MDRCNTIGTIPTVEGTRPALTTPLDGRRGMKATTGSPTGRGKGTGAASALYDVAQLKAAVVVETQEQPPCDGGAGHHDDRGDDGGMGQQVRGAERQ
jgi:hypothetical protein